jgi:hypothetical protein
VSEKKFPGRVMVNVRTCQKAVDKRVYNALKSGRPAPIQNQGQGRDVLDGWELVKAVDDGAEESPGYGLRMRVQEGREARESSKLDRAIRICEEIRNGGEEFESVPFTITERRIGRERPKNERARRRSERILDACEERITWLNWNRWIDVLGVAIAEVHGALALLLGDLSE